jgi:hypothetical protein
VPDTDTTPRGRTTSELAAYWRVSADRIRSLIVAGQLEAINTAPAGHRPRYIILPRHIEQWERQHRAMTSVEERPQRRRRRRTDEIDFFPD